MSLTSLLSSKEHPVAQWFAAQLPRTAALRRAYASTLPVLKVQQPIAAGRTVVWRGLLGTAIDERIRCSFVGPRKPAAVLLGVDLAANLGGTKLRDLGLDLLEMYVELVSREKPSRRGRDWVLDQVAEDRLDRLCFAMAWFERIYRDQAIAVTSPLADPEGCGDLEWLLELVPQYVVADLQVQIRLAGKALGALRDVTSESDCRAGPSFAGGWTVGGADADLLVGRSLLEIKSISRPQFLNDETIWQLAGYAILDFTDEHRIGELGFYMSRIGWLKTWGIEEFFALLGSRASLHQLRADFATEFDSVTWT